MDIGHLSEGQDATFGGYAMPMELGINNSLKTQKVHLALENDNYVVLLAYLERSIVSLQLLT